MKFFANAIAAASVLWSMERIAAQDQWLGQPVFLKDTAKPRVGTTPVDQEKIDFPATVEKIKGDWLWLGRAWVRKSDVHRTDEALAYYTEKIRRNPTSAAAWSNRGVVWDTKGEFDNAIKDFTEAIRLDPTGAFSYSNRGNTWRAGKQNYDNAIKDCTEAIRLDPAYATAYGNRGLAWDAKQEYDNAIKDYTEAIRLDPTDATAYNNIAWLRATCSDEKHRSGAEAVAMATKACELTAWTNALWIDTLAAAYAEAGEFNKAVEWQQKAIESTLAEDLKANFRSRLELYQSGKPYREEPDSADQ